MDTDIKKAEEKIEYLGSDPKTIALYKARERSLHERANMINGAREDKAIEIARASLENGLPIDIIVKITGLELSIIEELQNEIKNH